LVVTDTIFDEFPKLVLGVILLHNIDNSQNRAEITEILRQAEAAFPGKFGNTPVIEHPDIATWREAWSPRTNLRRTSAAASLPAWLHWMRHRRPCGAAGPIFQGNPPGIFGAGQTIAVCDLQGTVLGRARVFARPAEEPAAAPVSLLIGDIEAVGYTHGLKMALIAS
jgi:hypothetical protein